MELRVMAVLAAALAAASAQAQAIDPGFEKSLAQCDVDAGRMRAIAGFFDLRSDQSIAEFQPGFILTNCLADSAGKAGGFTMMVDGGDRLIQVAQRVTVQKFMKRDAQRYAGIALLEIDPGKAPPPGRAASLDRILIVGQAPAMLDDAKRASKLLSSLAAFAKPDALLGIVDVADKGGVDVDRLAATARTAGWDLADRMTTESGGLLLLKFRRL